MPLLIEPSRFTERRAIAAGTLAPLADGLAREMEPLVALARDGALDVPREKALLSRAGGRCAEDGTYLDFDPWSPHEHRCASCGRTYAGELQDRWWLYWYQLWLAERAVHGALLWRLRGDEGHRLVATTLLERYAARYLDYPNRDDVLGPGRVFFSTYLESIWLLQLCIALDLLEGDEDHARAADARALGARVRERVLDPSASVIASYDEGLSNRQVWNVAALTAAWTLLERPDRAAASLDDRRSGTRAHLAHALLPDGTWYEGENYHLFAHRGLWYAVTMAERLGVELGRDIVARFDRGFAAPFLTALPDLTLPSRRDSQYAISLRQPRFAELCELGLARRDDERLLAVLRSLYGDDVPRGDTGRSRTSADVERNLPGTALSRADLGWRSLLHARAELPPVEESTLPSVLLEGQGIAVFRRDAGRTYAALDYGHSGGGHGHPDRLNLLLFGDGQRWLDDMGTGSYVERTLFWYRSTLAHDAPLVDGRSQQRVHGRLLAHDERGAAGWVEADAAIAPGCLARRTLVTMPDYVVDELAWEADDEATVDLPLHVDGELHDGGSWRRAPLAGGDAEDDGFVFVHDTEARLLGRGAAHRFDAMLGGARATLWLRGSIGGEWWRAVAPGPPGTGERRFHLVRQRGRAGTVRSLWSWGAVADVQDDGERLVVSLADGTRHEHVRSDAGWHVDLFAGAARSSIDLEGRRDEATPASREQTTESALPEDAPAGAAELRLPAIVAHRGEVEDAVGWRRYALGEPHYRRSEESWDEAARPTATVTVGWTGTSLRLLVDVRKRSPLVLVPRGADNPWDNEPAEINGDGVQLYLAGELGSGGWLVVPDEGSSRARVRPIAGWGSLEARARWRRTPEGWSVDIEVPLAEATLEEPAVVALDLLVNETEPGRTRRRGQLVLSGGAGEFVYLRGDRHDPSRLQRFVLVPSAPRTRPAR